MLLDKLKAAGMGFLAILLLSSIVSQGFTTWQMVKSKNAYDKARVSLEEKGVSQEVLANLTQRVAQSEIIGQTTQERFDEIEKMIEEKAKPPVAPLTNEKPAIRAKPAKAPPTKEAINENLHLPRPTSPNVALLAVNELWVDFCKRFPGERDCRDRGLQATDLQAVSTARP